MKETRIKKLFDLLDVSEYKTAENLADNLGYSVKTIRLTIKELNTILKESSAQIVSYTGKGFRLEVLDTDCFNDFIANRWYEYAFSEENLNDKEYRIKLLLSYLFKGIKKTSEIWSEELHISINQIKSDLKEVKCILENHNLSINILDKKAVKIIGDEVDIRNFMQKIISVYAYIFDNELGIGLKYIRSYLEDELRRRNVNIGHALTKSLSHHIYISMLRIHDNHFLAENNDTSSFTGAISESIDVLLSVIEVTLHIKFSNAEIIYIKYLFCTNERRRMDINHIVSDENKLVTQIIALIKAEYNVDWCDNLELNISLASHISGMLTRIKHGLILSNPLLNTIKVNILAFNMAVTTGNFISEEFNCHVSEDEIAYLALYYGYFLELYYEKRNKKKILLICPSDKGSSKLIEHHFLKNFSKWVDKLEITTFFKLHSLNLDEYDLLISLTPITIKTSTPIILLENMLDASSFSHFNNLFLEVENNCNVLRKIFTKQLFLIDKKNTTKEEILKNVTNLMSSVLKCDAHELYDSIIKRERLASTEFPNRIALPHTLHSVSEETTAAIILLEKPMIWEKKRVQLIIVLALGKKPISDIEALYEKIGKFLTSKDLIKKGIDSKSYESIIELMESV